MIRESRRNNVEYRPHALAALGEFIPLRREVDWFEPVYDITRPIIERLVDNENEMDVESPSGGPSRQDL